MKIQTIQPTVQRGQAFTEFALVLGTSLAMMWGISYLAKLGITSQNMQEAARHAVFERTVWLEPATLPDQGAVVEGDTDIQKSVQHHFFTDTITRCELCETTAPDGSVQKDQGNQPQINAINDIANSTSDNAQAKFMGIIDTVMSAVYDFAGSDSSRNPGQDDVTFALDKNVLYRPQINAQVNLPTLFNALGNKLNMTSNATMLTNEWYARGNTLTGTQAIHQIQESTPIALSQKPKMQDLFYDLKELTQFINLTNGNVNSDGGIVFGNASDKNTAEEKQGLLAKTTDDGANLIADASLKQYTRMQGKPVDTSHIDPTNKIFELLP